jgi:UDP-glucose 4-epimerase
MGLLMSNSKKVVVFGGAGFLGSHVADALTKKGYEVIIFDIHESQFIDEKQKMVVGDILDSEQVNEEVRDSQYVYHFAGLADINEAKLKPVETITSNVLGTTNILEACRINNVERFVFASTIYVYSELGSFYRSSKQACELIIENYFEEYNLNYTILRYGSLYGRRANKFNFIRNAVTQALLDNKIDRKGDGEEVRDYIHVKDAAKASVEILINKFINSHIMIKGMQTIKVKELLLMINEIMGNNIKINYSKKVKYEGHYQLTPYSFRPRVAEKFLLNTYHDLGQGLLDTIYDVYKELYKNNPEKLSDLKIANPKE